MEGYPLFYDGMNEFGLAMAGLNFPADAHFEKGKVIAKNLCQFEFIPYLLGTCKDLKEARALLEDLIITDETFSENVPPSPLHWIIADKESSLQIKNLHYR